MTPEEFWRHWFEAVGNLLALWNCLYIPTDRTPPNWCGFVDAPTPETREMLGYGGI